MSTLLAYTHHLPGPTGVLVEVPGVPLEITVTDDRKARIVAELVGADANLIQVGPFGTRNAGVQMRAVDEKRDGRRTITSILPGAIFSQTASVKGNTNVVQCGGDMVMGGHGKEPGAYLIAPIGTGLELKAHGRVIVKYRNEVLTVPEAVARGLFELDGEGEAGQDR